VMVSDPDDGGRDDLDHGVLALHTPFGDAQQQEGCLRHAVP